jgi:hypothetical protein
MMSVPDRPVSAAVTLWCGVVCVCVCVCVFGGGGSTAGVGWVGLRVDWTGLAVGKLVLSVLSRR